MIYLDPQRGHFQHNTLHFAQKSYKIQGMIPRLITDTLQNRIDRVPAVAPSWVPGRWVKPPWPEPSPSSGIPSISIWKCPGISSNSGIPRVTSVSTATNSSFSMRYRQPGSLQHPPGHNRREQTGRTPLRSISYPRLRIHGPPSPPARRH